MRMENVHLLEEIPPQTGLDPICDFRQGARPEIVLLVRNEARRLPTLHEYYKDHFDLVLFDGGSTDETVELARRLQVTVFRRRGREGAGENHFVLYANSLCKSDFCGYFMADEYVSRDELIRLFEALRERPMIVLGRKVDWLFGERVHGNSGSSPRLFVKGSARYDPTHIHASLQSSLRNVEVVTVDVHHLHVWNMQETYGKGGLYAYSEVQQLRASNRTAYRLVKRFLLRPVAWVLSHLLHELKRGPALLTWVLLMAVVRSLLGMLAVLEQKYLPSPEQQLQHYLTFYDEK